jgi:hypothetical protein
MRVFDSSGTAPFPMEVVSCRGFISSSPVCSRWHGPPVSRRRKVLRRCGRRCSRSSPATGSFLLLAVAMRQLPLGTAYAVWTGIGAVGAFIFGIVMMGETLSLARVACAMLIVIGLIGLKLTSGH